MNTTAFPSAFPSALAVALALPSSALAGGKPVPGTEHDPPRFVDETSTLLSVHRRNNGYGVHLEAVVIGYSSKSDTFRLDWSQSGKVIATAKCVAAKSGKEAEVRCDIDDTPVPASAQGAIEGQLIYLDDQDNKEYLVRDYKVTVAKYPSAGDPVWQLVPDDLLAAGYVKHWKGHDSRAGRPNFILWTATGGEGHDLVLRCTVDGTKIDDIKASFSSAWVSPQTMEAVTHPKLGTDTRYQWAHMAIVPANLMFGAKPATGSDHQIWLADHPGQWMCEARTDAKPFRELRFKVNDQGMVESDDMQSGNGAPPLLHNIALIDLRIPKDSTFDLRVRPDAMRKSRGYGLPWPDHANVKAILSALPPSRGLPDPR